MERSAAGMRAVLNFSPVPKNLFIVARSPPVIQSIENSRLQIQFKFNLMRCITVNTALQTLIPVVRSLTVHFAVSEHIKLKIKSGQQYTTFA
jgi:hypothetical protein